MDGEEILIINRIKKGPQAPPTTITSRLRSQLVQIHDLLQDLELETKIPAAYATNKYIFADKLRDIETNLRDIRTRTLV